MENSKIISTVLFEVCFDHAFRLISITYSIQIKNVCDVDIEISSNFNTRFLSNCVPLSGPWAFVYIFLVVVNISKWSWLKVKVLMVCSRWTASVPLIFSCLNGFFNLNFWIFLISCHQYDFLRFNDFIKLAPLKLLKPY